MKKLIFILLTLLMLSSCTKTNKTREVLKKAGYHPIKVGGYGFFDCSEDDWFATRFTAYSPDSTEVVKGCVCSGLFKGNTIRLD